jgi:hypothetical protein
MGPDPENRVGDQDTGSPGRPVMVVIAGSDITLQLPWLQMIILCEVCVEVNKQLSIENVMQHCVFFVRYKPRLKNELSKKPLI